MKTEEILRYEAEFKAMQEALGTALLVFDFPRQRSNPRDQVVDSSRPRNRRGECVKAMSPG
jgi:hypothetical protein